MRTPRTAVVLGGGVGGLIAANRLRKRLPATDRVLVFEREVDHLFQPSLLWLAVGQRSAAQIKRPLRELLKPGIELRTQPVDAINAERRIVTAGGETVAADAIVVALGAELAPELIPGLAEGGHNLYTLDGAAAIEHALRGMTHGHVVVLTATPAYRCPAAPYEAAMLIRSAVQQRGLLERIAVAVYAAEAGPMGVTGPVLSGQVRAMVESQGIAYHPEHQVTRVDAAARRLEFANGTTAAYDLLVYVPPHRAPGVVRDAGLANDSGYVPVDRHTMATHHAGVFAIGDVTGIPLAMGKPLPKAGVFAHRQGEVVADNIAAEWSGSATRRWFTGYGECFLEIGDGRAGYGAGDFYAEPTPQVRMRFPKRRYHWGKILFERRWLRRWW